MSAIDTVSGSRRGQALRRLGGAALLGALLLRAVVAPGHAAAQGVDADGDGLSDVEETTLYGTDPARFDTDGDGLSDGYEVHSDSSAPLVSDTDGDGANDGTEVLFGTDSFNRDTDGDALWDGYEVATTGTNPASRDTDGDGRDDLQELNDGTNPLLPDGAPATPAAPGQADPVPAERADSDGDGLYDDDEADVYGTDPFVADSDGDGADDGQEVYDGTDPLN